MVAVLSVSRLIISPADAEGKIHSEMKSADSNIEQESLLTVGSSQKQMNRRKRNREKREDKWAVPAVTLALATDIDGPEGFSSLVPDVAAVAVSMTDAAFYATCKFIPC